MKHLKNFNEGFSQDQRNSLEISFLKAKVSPQTEKLPINRVYEVLFIECSDAIDYGIDDELGRYLVVDLGYGSYTSVFESLDDAVQSLPTDNSHGQRFDECDSWDIFKGQNSDRLVNVLEYNDVNFQEIENILIDYNISVDNIWGLMK